MSDTLQPAGPSRGRAIFYVIVIFVAGAVFGSALTLGVGRHLMQQKRDPAAWNVDALRRLDRQLDLTAEQRSRVQPILVDMLMRLRETRVSSRRESIAIVQDSRDKLRAELTPEQQVKFDQLAARMRENLGRFMDVPRGNRRVPAGEPTPKRP